MAILQEVDKCMRCGGCTTACKRTWTLKNFTNIADVKPQRAIVNPRQRLAIKSQKRVDMGPFIRFSCWHCPDPPCAKACPLGAITKEANGAVSVDNVKCNPSACKSGTGPRPCEIDCQRGGYPKVGEAYESGAYAGLDKMNKCTLCSGRAGLDDPAKSNMLPTTATLAEVQAVPEKAHMPACVSTCPAKAMKWDTRENLIAYANANYYLADGTKNWYGNGSMMWGSKKVMLTPAKADPFIEDHISPMTSSLLSGSKMILPTIVVGGLAALSARRVRNEEASAVTGGEV
jgi:Fe-S-cluster-containing dehydrogenase component